MIKRRDCSRFALRPNQYQSLSSSVSPPTRTTTAPPEPGARAPKPHAPPPAPPSSSSGTTNTFPPFVPRLVVLPRPRAPSPSSIPAACARAIAPSSVAPPKHRPTNAAPTTNPAISFAGGNARESRVDVPRRRCPTARPRVRSRARVSTTADDDADDDETTRMRALRADAFARARVCGARAGTDARAGTLALRGFGVFFSPGARAMSSNDRSAHARATTPSNARRERETRDDRSNRSR